VQKSRILTKRLFAEKLGLMRDGKRRGAARKTRKGESARVPVPYYDLMSKPLHLVGLTGVISLHWAGRPTNDPFAFLTTEPNAIVAPIHPKAIPVILTKAEEIETWLTAPIGEASLQSDRGL
jgi:putative SOS response-associated peptidase YedK